MSFTLPTSFISRSNILSLDDVIARLCTHGIVIGVIAFGSHVQNRFNPHSDYDLLVVLKEMPAPLHVAITYIDHRLTDVIFTTLNDINELIVSNEPVAGNSFEGRLLYWLATGNIHCDPTGKLKILQKMLSMTDWLTSGGTSQEIHDRWWNTNYNIWQNRRILQAQDNIYNMAVDLRHLYNISLLWSDYFLVRHISRSGEKGEIIYLHEYDPDFLQNFRALLAEPNRFKKQKQFEILAKKVFLPYAPMWEEETTHIALIDVHQPRKIKEAYQFWESLLTPISSDMPASSI